MPSTAAAASERDRYFDVLRAIALVRVVAFHVFVYGWLTFAFPAMGVMFALAGSLTAKSLQKAPAHSVVVSRLRRLLPPYWVFGVLLVPIMIWHGWGPESGDERPLNLLELANWIIPLLDPPASDWGANIVSPLWYVRTYLWLVLLSPLLLASYRRWPVATTLSPLTFVILQELGFVDFYALGLFGSALVDLGTFGSCWMLGFAHRSGSIRRMPIRRLLVLAGCAFILALAWIVPHPHPDYGYNLNEMPLGQALWAIGPVLLMMRFEPSMNYLDRVPFLRHLIRIINARALTIYLWHNVAIDLAVRVNDTLELWTQPELLLTTWILIAVPVLCIGWVEDFAARRRLQLIPIEPQNHAGKVQAFSGSSAR